MSELSPLPLRVIRALRLQHERPGLALTEWPIAAAKGVPLARINDGTSADLVTALLREAEVGAELRRLAEAEPTLRLSTALARAEGRIDGGPR